MFVNLPVLETCLSDRWLKGATNMQGFVAYRRFIFVLFVLSLELTLPTC
jgi:hypothetical protein